MDFEFVFNFLLDLRKNNDRDWFKDQKKRYTQAREIFVAFVKEIITGISEFDQGIVGLEPKDCMFRINRDIRFSPDKTPYNTHFSAAMIPGGKKNHLPGYYVMVKPGELSYIGGGIWRPSPENLAKIRQEIDYNPTEIRKVLNSKSFSQYFGDTLDGEQLKRPPKGYDASHPEIELLKHKDFVAGKSLTDKEVLKPGFKDQCLQIFSEIRPMNQYFSMAMEG